jgi:LacI family transcriptional regulator
MERADRPVTMRDVAHLAGVALSTVSRALRDDPAIPLVRRSQIKRLAEEIGYHPNPLVSTLMAQVHGRRRTDDPGHIAWIDLWPSHAKPPAVLMFQLLVGARQRAQALGYKIEVYSAAQSPLQPARLRQILLARSQWGFIIPPVPEHAMHFPLEMSHLAGVTIGTSLVEPVLHRVTTNHFHNARLAWDTLHGKGFKRIGLALSPRMNARLNGLWLGGYVAASFRTDVVQVIPPLLVSESEATNFQKWFHKFQPDALLVSEAFVAQWAQAQNKTEKIPAVAWLALEPEAKNVWGLDYRAESIGAAAVDMVVGQIHRNERGSPASPHTLLLDSVWTER